MSFLFTNKTQHAKKFKNEDEEYPGKLEEVDYWASEILDFTFADQEDAFTRTEPVGEIAAETVVENIPTHDKQIQSIPYRHQLLTTVNKHVAALFDGIKMEVESKGASKHEDKYRSHSVRFHDGINMTYKLVAKDTLRNLLQADILGYHAGDYFSKEPNRLLDGQVIVEGKLYPDTTSAVDIYYKVAPFIVATELRFGNTGKQKQLGYEVLAGLHSKRVTFEVFHSYLSRNTGYKLLGRAYSSEQFKFDIGGEIYFNEGSVSNASFYSRFNSRNTESKKKWSIVWSGNAMGYNSFSYTSQLSNVLGVTASAQLRYDATTAHSDVGFGVEVDPTCAQNDGKDAYREDFLDYALKARLDTQKGIACMLKKRNFWNNKNASLYFLVTRPIALSSRYEQEKMEKQINRFGGIKFGVGINLVI